MFTLKKITSACVLVTLLAGCSSLSNQRSSADAFAQIQAINAQFKMANQSSNSPLPVSTEAFKKEDILSDQSLVEKKKIIFDAGKTALFSQEKSGLQIDGQTFLDPEGSILSYGSSNLTGEFCYLIAGSSTNEKILKYNRAHSNQESLKVAVITNNFGQVKVSTVNGKNLAGTNITPTSSGFLVSRGDSLFQYQMAQPMQTFNTIKGYHVAKFQNGDITNTGYILLEKNDEPKSSVGSVFSSLKGLGNTFGLVEVNDYLLVNIKNKNIVPLNLPSGSKKVSVYSNCRKGSGFVNKCDNVNLVESLYDTDGRPNYDHYYWSVNWLQTKSGALAFYKESTKVKAIDLKNHQKYTLFSRTLGVNYFTVKQKENGHIEVFAKLGFSSDTIGDVEEFISTNQKLAEPISNIEL